MRVRTYALAWESAVTEVGVSAETFFKWSFRTENADKIGVDKYWEIVILQGDNTLVTFVKYSSEIPMLSIKEITT